MIGQIEQRIARQWFRLKIRLVKISVIVPAFNEEKMIGVCLEDLGRALAGFAELGWGSEVIVCDNNSTDRTAELARAAGARVVSESVNQIARARNTGAAAATGDWLIFVDADSRPNVGLFRDVARQIAGGRCLAGGATVRFDEESVWMRVGTVLWNGLSRLSGWMAGSFIFCQASAFREVGGFNQELFVSEEIDLSRRLKRLAAARGMFVVILHDHPLVTSARKVRLYGPGHFGELLWRFALRPRRTLRDRQACAIWYDGRR